MLDYGPYVLDNGPYVLGNRPQVLGNGNGPPVLGNHVILSCSASIALLSFLFLFIVIHMPKESIVAKSKGDHRRDNCMNCRTQN